ncbi:MAG: SpoIID/LytB domain-containing protein, partial [Anaerolineae bacterium]|nr:SpoIID/LytB domain-containing protein [Anaerolineae bacterium]
MTHTLQRSLAAEATQLDFEMIPRYPSAEQEAVIDAKMRHPPSLLHAFTDESLETLQTGLTGVTTVPSTIRVKMLDGTIVTMEMDEYLKGVVPYEMSPSWPTEALKAQAVAARSYAATNSKHHDEGYDVCTTTCCQFWGPTHYDTTDAAVEATHGVAAFYDGSIIHAFYHGHCDGHTRSYCESFAPEDPNCVEIPYLQPVECPCGHDELRGHGVGMCQEGARALARDQGKSYVEILQHYYTGITV